MEARTLTCEGRLVATAELADTYGYDTDAYDHVFVFRRDNGYELLVVGRTERYRDDGDLASATARVDVTVAPNVAALADVVDARWPSMSGAWWQLLESGRHNDAELHAAWLPEHIRRDLDAASIYDKRLATQTGYFGGTSLSAEGRNTPAWQDKAVADMAAKLKGLGWEVRPGPELSPDAEPGAIFSTCTVVVGSLWASRFGHEAAVIVRVDDCGEIYARLADPQDLLEPLPPNRGMSPGANDSPTWGDRHPVEVIPVFDAIHRSASFGVPGDLGAGLDL